MNKKTKKAFIENCVSGGDINLFYSKNINFYGKIENIS